MEYTVSGLAKLSGVSPRTLRYYDEIKLLTPAKMNDSGYRIYTQVQVERLQQILFYKTMEIPLDEIGDILDAKGFDPLTALRSHRKRLIKKQSEIEKLLHNIDQSMNELKGGRKMNNQDKFEGFKEKMIQDNEAKYGSEVREAYGDKTVDQYNDKIRKMTQNGYDKASKLGIIIIEKLKEGFVSGETIGPLAEEIYDLHKEWIMCYWTSYSTQGHKGLGDMYIQDERFKEYYDKEQAGLAQYLRNVIHANAKD